MQNTCIFISYRRDGGEFLGKIFYDELTKRGYSVFYDVESMRSGKFNEQLYRKIEECQDFIILLTPNSLERCKNNDDWVRLEYEHAVKNNKNIIPILARDFKFPENLPESMKELPMYERIEAKADGMETALKKLERMIKSEPTVLSEADEKSEFKPFSKLAALCSVHLIVFLLYFLVFVTKFQIKEVFWLIAFAGNILFAVVGMNLTVNFKEKVNIRLGIFYSAFCFIFSVFCLICGFLQ